MCVSRYKQHSSRDKRLGPRPLGLPTLPTLSLHPPALAQVCLCVCVCVYVFLFTLGPAGPVWQHSQGVTEKTAVRLSDSEKTLQTRRSRGPTGMPVKTVLFGVSTTISILSSPSSSCQPLLFLHIITICLSEFIALLTATFESFIHLSFHFVVLHLLSLFIGSDRMTSSSLYLSYPFAVVLLFTRSSSYFNSASYNVVWSRNSCRLRRCKHHFLIGQQFFTFNLQLITTEVRGS